MVIPSDLLSTLKIFETYVQGEKKEYERRIDDFHVRIRSLEESLSRERASFGEERRTMKASWKSDKKSLQARIGELEETVRSANEQVAQLSLLDPRSNENEKLRTELFASRARAEEAETQLASLRDEYMQSCSIDEEHRNKMEKYVKELMADSQAYQKECQSLTERIDRLARESESLRQKARDADREKDHTAQVVELLRQKLAAKDLEISSITSSLDKLTKEKKVLSDSISAALRQKESAESELERKSAEVSRLKDWLSLAKSESSEEKLKLKQDLAALTRQKENLEISEKNAKKKLAETENKVAQLTDEDRPMEDVNLSLMFKVNKLEHIIKEQNAKLLMAEKTGDDVFACLKVTESKNSEWLEPLVVSNQFIANKSS